MNICYNCERECAEWPMRYCDDCRWDIHFSRNWNCKDYTKEEWKNEQRLQRLRKR